MSTETTFLSAFLAGLASFLSPCVLPLVPAYLSFLAGVDVGDLQAETAGQRRGRVLPAAVSFVLGFSCLFILLGAGATAVSRWLAANSALLSRIAGGLIILLGLHVSGLVRFRGLEVERRFHPRRRPLGVLGAFVVGVAFAFGWTPCVGPLLAAILALAGTRETLAQGMLLLGTYSAGLGIPFLIAAAGLQWFLRVLHRFKHYLRWVEVVAGILLLWIGTMMLTGGLHRLAAWIAGWNFLTG